MTEIIPAGTRHEQASRLPISNSALPLSERQLVHLWDGQRFPQEALLTRDGERLRVVYRGRRVGGPGPDFRDAMIAARGGLLRGDVELHVRSSDFHRHGHDRDPAYDNVVLHLVFQDDEGTDTLLACGRGAPVVALGDWVEGRARELRRWLDRPAQWREPCFGSIARMGLGEVGAALDRLGDMRFGQKTAAFAPLMGEAEDAEELIWNGLLEALGYGGQREAFRLLAGRLPWSELRPRLTVLPVSQRAAEAARLLHDAAVGLFADKARQGARPGNRPEDRLAGAAQQAARFASHGLMESMAPLLDEPPEWALKAFMRLLTVPRLIGRSRALEILSNVVLPCLAALGPEERTGRAESLQRRLPRPARYGAVRHLHEALGKEVRVNARRQQGMLYLLKQYCTQGGCGRCPLS